MNKKPRVYVSGAITGHDREERKALFAAEAEKLRAQGFDVVDPFEITGSISADGDWPAALRADIREPVGCPHRFPLPGAYKSRGARLERNLATRLGIRVMYAPGERERWEKRGYRV